MKIKLPTAWGLLYKYIIFMPAIVFFTSGAISYSFQVLGLHLPSGAVIFLIIVVVLAIDAIRFIPRTLLTMNRSKKVATAMSTESFTPGLVTITPSPLFEALEQRDEGGSQFFGMSAPNWAFLDYRFNNYIRYKGERYLTSNVYYSVVQIPLPRQLPHIVFDSKHMRGQQMRFSFDKNQKISLEGNFDTYFDTYFPAHYEIDLLSIITPEVMEALISAQEFDIEIYSGTIRLYSPMLPAPGVPQAIQLGLSIRDKLMNNIITYSDDRLTADSRKTVHAYGFSIQDNFRLRALGLGLVGVAIPVSIVLILAAAVRSWQIVNSIDSVIYLVFAFLLMLRCFGGAISILKKGYGERRGRRDASRQ